MPPLLEVKGLETQFRTGAGTRARRRRDLLHRGAGRNRGASSAKAASAKLCGRSRSWCLIPDPGRAASRPRDPVRWPRPARPQRGGDAPGARPRHRHGVPGADDLAQSGAHHRPPDHRGAGRASRCGCSDGASDAPSSSSRPACIAVPRAAAEAVPASAFGRHAAASDDCYRARLQSEADHRRRADDGFGRHDPGADPRTDEVTDGPPQRRADRHHP